MKKKNKEIMVGVRFTEQDKEIISNAADGEGLTVASFIRKVVLQYVDGKIVESRPHVGESPIESRIKALEEKVSKPRLDQ